MKTLMIVLVFSQLVVNANELAKQDTPEQKTLEIGLTPQEVSELVLYFNTYLYSIDLITRYNKGHFLELEKELGVTQAEVDHVNQCLSDFTGRKDNFDFEEHFRVNKNLNKHTFRAMNYGRRSYSLEYESNFKGQMCFSLGFMWSKFFGSGRTPLYSPKLITEEKQNEIAEVVKKTLQEEGNLSEEEKVQLIKNVTGGLFRSRATEDPNVKVLTPVEKTPQYPFSRRLAQLIGFCNSVATSAETALLSDGEYSGVGHNDFGQLKGAIGEFRSYLLGVLFENEKVKGIKK